MIISNATPLIAFARIDQLSLLQKVVGKVFIPLGVAQEISAYKPGPPGSIDLAHESWIETVSVKSEDTVSLLLSTLDRGEAEVIALALEVDAQVVLMDELTGRKVAESLNLKVTGSVGLLIRAKQLGHILAVKPYLQAMRDAGIYFSDRFIQAVLQQFDEG
ncbi:DUF3368 domain-containing protein [Leptolyngbya sp. PCC 6406]|uniref:DUF3368 domain-containing protein n=1 Tax=Leptolyngbya sp. PCC 6406 TaxID=1173264 RepID=UPI0002ABC8AB|nr:DUF3368 domain-containing protein [Leptolyngbya sp. PCC 6406]